ncbi:MAG: histidine kinase [Flavobacteriales bacterium]|nr:histidine kinase [Flavobacteriales bacterium]
MKLTKTVKKTSQDLKKSQRDFFIGIIVFLLVLILLGTVIFFLKLRNVKSEAQNIMVEQKLLRSQMTPHFIFNSLSVLQGMILNKEEKKAVSYSSKFSKLLRIILENSRDKTVSLDQELTAVENYLTLHNIEESQSYEYTVLVDDTVDKFQFKIPPMLIQPFIENAIEHAFGGQKLSKKIDIKLTYLGKKLICTITDNGIGINAQKENKEQHKRSLATTITSERLNILSKDFKMKGSISIEDRQRYNEQGTIVTLVIPYKIDVA